MVAFLDFSILTWKKSEQLGMFVGFLKLKHRWNLRLKMDTFLNEMDCGIQIHDTKLSFRVSTGTFI